MSRALLLASFVIFAFATLGIELFGLNWLAFGLAVYVGSQLV